MGFWATLIILDLLVGVVYTGQCIFYKEDYNMGISFILFLLICIGVSQEFDKQELKQAKETK